MSGRAHIHLPTGPSDRLADKVTAFFGTWLCLGLHTLWFVLWFAFGLDVALLTNVVSLEAIALAILIMMSQSRQTSRDRKRDDLEANEVSTMLNTHQELLEMNRSQLKILNQQSEILDQQTEILNLLHKVKR